MVFKSKIHSDGFVPTRKIVCQFMGKENKRSV